jgi:hypothetical protein
MKSKEAIVAWSPEWRQQRPPPAYSSTEPPPFRLLSFREACEAALMYDPAEDARTSLADNLAEAARDLTRPPGPQSTDRVKLRSEPLSTPIYWQGHQWAVTSHGVECRDGTYYIAKDRLWESDDTDHGWVHHMADKNWVDLADFAEALHVARQHFAGLYPAHPVPKRSSTRGAELRVSA